MNKLLAKLLITLLVCQAVIFSFRSSDKGEDRGKEAGQDKDEDNGEFNGGWSQTNFTDNTEFVDQGEHQGKYQFYNDNGEVQITAYYEINIFNNQEFKKQSQVLFSHRQR